MKKPELLAPAGSLSKLKIAITYGADAVYVGGEEFSLRVAAENFSPEEMKEGVKFAHDRGKKVYLTANIIPHNSDIDQYEKFLREYLPAGFDAIIVSDLGMFQLTREIAPDLEIHISTQANNVNYKSAESWHKMGAKRVILAREMSFQEIEEIRKRTNPELELEAFVHGAMCISYSGRCLLSNYMTNRDSNQGACSHPCRWKYNLVEETRPGEYMPVFENDRGTFIYNSKDLCMIEHIKELIESGLNSFKIEGRVKTEYYLATVVKAYRDAIDSYFENPEGFTVNPMWLEEIKKVSHRDYTTGFFFKKPDGNEQNYKTSSYIRNYELLGMVEDYDEETGFVTVIQKNRFFEGSEVEFLMPKGDFIKVKIEYMEDEDGNELKVANRPQSKARIKINTPIERDSMMRGVREN